MYVIIEIFFDKHSDTSGEIRAEKNNLKLCANNLSIHLQISKMEMCEVPKSPRGQFPKGIVT